jgi:hypothetical protein
MCSKCKTDCKTQIGSVGIISERAAKRTSDTYCTWIIDTASVGYKYLIIWGTSLELKATNYISIETCTDSTCITVSAAFDVYGSESHKLIGATYTSRTGISRITFTPKLLDKDEGFRLQWQGVC